MTGAVILAAGYGQADNGISKLLQTIDGKTPIIVQVVRNVGEVSGVHPVVVVLNDHNGSEIRKALDQYCFRGLEFITQPDRLGPADAFHRSLPVLREVLASSALVVFGDMPLLSSELMRDMVTAHKQNESDYRTRTHLTISSWMFDSRNALAPIVRNYTYLMRGSDNGHEATPLLQMYSGTSPSDGDDVLSSLYVVNLDWFSEMFPRIDPVAKDDRTPERHMPKLIEQALVHGSRVNNLRRPDIASQIIGVDAHTPESLEVVCRLHAARLALRS